MNCVSARTRTFFNLNYLKATKCPLSNTESKTCSSYGVIYWVLKALMSKGSTEKELVKAKSKWHLNICKCSDHAVATKKKKNRQAQRHHTNEYMSTSRRWWIKAELPKRCEDGSFGELVNGDAFEYNHVVGGWGSRAADTSIWIIPTHIAKMGKH